MATTTNIYCDFNAGDDSAGDGTPGNPYKTFQKGVDTATGINPGDGADTTIWLRGTVPYEEAVTVTEDVVAATTAPLIVEGYTDTPGDGGMAALDGTNSKAKGLSLFNSSADNNNYYWVLKNIEIKRYTEEGMEGHRGAGFMNDVIFRHCRFGNNDVGVRGARGHSFLDCWFHDNASYGVEGTWLDEVSVLRSIFEDNATGLHLGKSNSSAIWNSLFIGNTTVNIATNNGVPIVNCVIDGKNKASAIGVSYPDPDGVFPKILNTIILDCVAGVQGLVAGAEELSAIFNSCFYLNTNDFTQGAAARTGCIFADPQFVDRDNKDYGIEAASPCKEAGLDLKSYDFYTSTASKVDIGLLQEARSLSGGSGIGAPLGFSVER